MKSSLMLGVNPLADRQVDDFYATDPKALELFYEKFNQDGNKIAVKVWEPSCGMGHLSKVLENHGHLVLSTDLINRGYGEGGINFLDDVQFNTKDFWDGDILTNPPFRLAEEFVEKGMTKLVEGKHLYFCFSKSNFLKDKKERNCSRSIHHSLCIVTRQGNFVAKMQSLKSILPRHNFMLGMFGKKDLLKIR